jgi:hypothetical protein
VRDPGGPSLLGVCNTAQSQEIMDLGRGVARVADMLVLALASGRAFAFESPHETHMLAFVLGDHSVIVSLHHARDRGVP